MILDALIWRYSKPIVTGGKGTIVLQAVHAATFRHPTRVSLGCIMPASLRVGR